MINLVSNAIKYTRPRALAEIEIAGRTEGREEVYWVKDNGVGFDMDYAQKLFGVFQRFHFPTEFEGTGVGQGTTIYFALPAATDQGLNL